MSIQQLEAELQAAKDSLSDLAESPVRPARAEDDIPSNIRGSEDIMGVSMQVFEARLAELEAKHRQELTDKDAAHAKELTKLKAKMSLAARQREEEEVASDSKPDLDSVMKTKVILARKFALDVKWVNFAKQLLNQRARFKWLGTEYR